MRSIKSLIIVGAYAIAIYIITANTPTVPAVSDYAFYVDMAQGNPAPEPWNKRVLVPFIASLFGGTEKVFHYMNLLLLLLTCIMMVYIYKDYLTPLLFLYGVIIMPEVVGEAGIDAMIYFLITLSILLAEKDIVYAMPLVSVLAAMTHPIAFIITSLILITEREEYSIILGGFVFAILMPTTYGVLYIPDFQRLKWTLGSLSFLWLGIFTLGDDVAHSLRDCFVISCCFGFTFLASHAGRMMASAGIVLAPRASRFIKRYSGFWSTRMQRLREAEVHLVELRESVRELDLLMTHDPELPRTIKLKTTGKLILMNANAFIGWTYGILLDDMTRLRTIEKHHKAQMTSRLPKLSKRRDS